MNADQQPAACLGGCGLYGDPLWCPGCSGRVRTRLLGLPALMALRLATADGHRSGPDSERVAGGSVEASSQSPAYDQLDEMVRKLSRYRCLLTGQNQILGQRVSVEQLESAVGWLSVRFELAIGDARVGGQLGRSVHVWHARLVAQTKTGNGTRTLAMACPRCETRSLVLKDGDDTVRCSSGGCGHQMSEDDYQLYEQAMANWIARADERRRRRG